MRPNALAQFANCVHILTRRRELAITTFFIEREIQKKYPFKIKPEQLTGSARFGFSNKSLELAKRGAVFVKGSFFFELGGQLVYVIFSAGVEGMADTELVQQADSHSGFIVGHPQVTGGQVRKSHLMLMTSQAMKRS